MKGGTYKNWTVECGCGFEGKTWGWSYDFPLPCPNCGENKVELPTPKQVHGIVPDDIPGGILIKHGLCNKDGSPKRYYSKTEIKREANKRGLIIGGDTPKQYKVAWDGIRTDQ